MSPAARFHATISTITIFVMFWLMTYLLPILKTHTSLTAIGALVGSVGIYRLLAFGVGWLLLRWHWAKRKFFGPYYMEGTWVGWFVGHAGDKRIMIEHYAQDFDGVIVKGRSYTDTLKEHGYWATEVVTVDARKGRMVFTYSFDVLTRSAGLTGMSTFDFERTSAHDPPTAISGFAHDLNDPTRIAVHSTKISDKFLRWDDALKVAASKFLP